MDREPSAANAARSRSWIPECAATVWARVRNNVPFCTSQLTNREGYLHLPTAKETWRETGERERGTMSRRQNPAAALWRQKFPTPLRDAKAARTAGGSFRGIQ